MLKSEIEYGVLICAYGFLTAAAFFLCCFRPWEQIIQERQISVFCMGGQLSQKIVEVFVHIQVVCLCSLN